MNDHIIKLLITNLKELYSLKYSIFVINSSRKQLLQVAI